MSKMCVSCCTTKPADAFYKHPNTKDRLTAKCRECSSASVRANQKKHAKRYKAYYKERDKKYRLEKMKHTTIKEPKQEYGVIMRQVLNFRRAHPHLKVNDCIQIMSNDNTDLIRDAWRLSLEYLPEKKLSPLLTL